MVGSLKTITGKRGEIAARQFLLANGLKLVTENYRCKLGEVDLIMRDQEYLVFVEVRIRNHRNYGSALDSVNKSKQRKILLAATHFLQSTKLMDKVSCRFDVVGVKDEAPAIEWIKNAFSAEY